MKQDNKKPIPLEERLEKIHSKMLHLFVDGGLIARHLKNVTRADLDVYPVIIGGINLMRCARLHPKAVKLLGKLYKNDIDIKYVVTKKIDDNNDPIAKKAHEMRLNFINKIMADPIVQHQISNLAKTMQGLEIKLTLKEYSNIPREAIKRSMLMSVKAEYILNGKPVLKKGLIDTGLYTTYSQDYFDSYHVFFMKEIKYPIPFRIDRRIPFATCGWAYYDTIRMLVVCGDAYKKAIEDNDIDEQKYQFLKYIKYLGKFAVLFTQVNRIKDEEDFDNISGLYKSAHKVFSKYGMRGYDVQLLEEADKKTLESIVSALQRKTNLTQLEKAVRSSA